MSNEFDAAVTAAMQPDQGQAARVGFSIAADTNPDAYAEAQRVARRTGVPVTTVLNMPGEMKRQAAVGSIDFDTLAQTSPATAALLADVERAKVAHDNVENMGEIERKIRQFGGGAVEAVGMAASGTGRLLDVAQRGAAGWAGLFLPTPMAGGVPTLDSLAGPMIGEDWQTVGKGVKNFARDDMMVPASQQTFGDQVAGGLGQVLGQIVMLPVARGAGLYAQGADAVGEKIDKADPNGDSPVWMRDLATVGGAGVTGVTEKWALDKLLGPMAVPIKNQIAASLARIGIASAAEGGQEFSENVLHDLLVKSMINPSHKVDLGESMDEGGVGAAVGGIVRTVVEAGLHIKTRGDRGIKQAEEGAAFLEGLNKLAAADKVLARDPETFEAFVAHAAEGAPVQDVFISAQTLQQSGIVEQLAAVSPAVAAQYNQALQTGGDVRIPVAEYTARIAPTEMAPSLLDHLKTEPEGMSRAEAQEYMQSGQAQELEAEVERVLAEKEGDGTFKQSTEAVRSTIKEQLDLAARFTPQVNDAYASMVGNFYAVMGAKIGITPEEMFKRYPLKIGAEGVDGPQFDQSGKLVTDTPNFKNWFGESKVVGSDGAPIVVYHGSPDARFVDDDGVFATMKDRMLKWGNTPESKRDAKETRAFFFTSSKAVANTYADDNRAFDYQNAEAGVIPTYVSIKNPLVFDAKGAHWREAQKQISKDDFIKQAKKGGHDGVIIKNVRDSYDSMTTGKDPKSDVIVAFESNQIKHAERNNGQFDANDPNILHQADKLLAMFDDADTINIEAPKMSEQEIDNEQRLFLSAFPKSVATYRRSSGIARKMRKSSDRATDELGGEAERTREVNSPLGPFSAYRVTAEQVAPDGMYNPDGALKVKIYGKEQIDAGLMDEPALTFTIMRDGELSVNGPTPGGATFNEFKARGWAEQSKAGDQIAEGWSNLVNPKGGKMPIGQVMDMLGDVHARVRAWKMEDYTGLHWSRATGALAALGDYGSAAFFQNKEGNRGSFNPANLSITLLKNADLSTFLHESGHFFLEVQATVAEQLQQEADIFGFDTLKPGEQQIVKDTQALLDWFGVKDLAEWNGLDFEEKRSYHEKFARGFEAYLFEGTAPSIEMQGLFQRFRAWMVSVYKDLKALNVDLTDEVRGVFDRMLASGEQITLAEQGRSMMPLFTSPEQIGMTPDEFAAYQQLGVDATNEAIEDLQGRGLRDMQWLHNARGRIIRQLQKEAAAKRAEVQVDVRREVMSQPLYRAWQFLTGKVSTDDQIEPNRPPKSSPDSIDETIDSLFVAVAKLGGMNKSEVVSTWGTDPADKPTSGVFGKPVWRVEGGLSIDDMATQLGQYGYLTQDEHGKVDLAEFEERFDAEVRGDTQYSHAYDPGQFQEVRPGDQVANPAALAAGRLDRSSLAEMGLPAEIIAHLDQMRMVKKDAIHPDIVAEMFGFTSGDELVRRLAVAETPKEEIAALTDVRMLEQYGDLSSEQAIEKAADKAIHNDVRARMIATEANALAKATGQRKVLASAAKEYARILIARLKVRDIRPGQYASAEVRAAKASEKASKSGDLATAAAEKRNQLINNYATRAAYDAQDEVEKGVRYLKKFESEATRKGLDTDYTDQIDALLERFDLRKGQSLKAIDKRAALAEWIKAQREAGLEPDIPAALENEAFRASYKTLTVEEFRGLVDTVKQIEHLGRLKHKLLTTRDQRAYEAVRDQITASIHEHAQGREADTRTPTTNMGRAVQGLKRFWAAHIKAATWARVMDGGLDGGPMWEYFVRSANEAGDRETTMRAEATGRLSEILAPVFAMGKMGGKGVFFPTINRSLNREARIALALNTGNEGNLQRLLGGEGWNVAQVMPVLQSLTAQEWAAVQAVWDHFESYRPQIGAKERRVYGKEPEWVTPKAFSLKTADGKEITVRGGYYPIKFDPAASQRAEEHADAEGAKRQLQGAYTTATTRRSFTKSRVEEVSGRPLLYTLSGMYSGVNDVIHDLAWHEWLVDANRLLRSKTIDGAIREHYGPEAKQQFKTWVQDVAEGEKGADAAVDLAIARLRQGVSAAGLGFNVMSAAIQPLGITQSIVRIGPEYAARGVMKYLAHPLESTQEVNGKSSFMENRARTRFRELNELRNQVQDQTAFRELTGRYAYFLMMRCQQMVDVPTWLGAYEKAIAQGNDEDLAVNLADQAVIDAQGGGQTKDLSAIERGGPTQKLFTVFYSFMNTALNMGISQTMSADTPAKKAKLAADYALLYVVPAILGYFLKNAITPGDSGDDDMSKIAKKLAANQIDYLMGLMVVVREFGESAKLLAGANDMGRDYTGPAGLRLVADSVGLAKQASQGEFDDAFRKAAINVVGDLFGLPSAQVNRTITGTKALAEGKTNNPASVVFGFQEKR